MKDEDNKSKSYGRVTVLSEKPVKDDVVTGSVLLFYPDPEKIIFWLFLRACDKFAFLSVSSHGIENSQFDTESEKRHNKIRIRRE